MNELTKATPNNKAFANKTVNTALLRIGTSRENIALGKKMKIK